MFIVIHIWVNSHQKEGWSPQLKLQFRWGCECVLTFDIRIPSNICVALKYETKSISLFRQKFLYSVLRCRNTHYFNICVFLSKFLVLLGKKKHPIHHPQSLEQKVRSCNHFPYLDFRLTSVNSLGSLPLVSSSPHILASHAFSRCLAPPTPSSPLPLTWPHDSAAGVHMTFSS